MMLCYSLVAVDLKIELDNLFLERHDFQNRRMGKRESKWICAKNRIKGKNQSSYIKLLEMIKLPAGLNQSKWP
jgi:hypothetical protein